MNIKPLPDGRLAIIFSTEEHDVLDKLAKERKVDKAEVSLDVYNRLMTPSHPALVEAIARLPR